MLQLINPPPAEDDDINLALLRIAFPAFWFSQYIRGRRLRWVAVRKNDTDPGLHTMVTDDPDELCTALLLDAAETDAPGAPGTAYREQGRRPHLAYASLAELSGEGSDAPARTTSIGSLPARAPAGPAPSRPTPAPVTSPETELAL